MPLPTRGPNPHSEAPKGPSMPLPGYSAAKPIMAGRRSWRARSQGYDGVGGIDRTFLLRTAFVSSMPAESSHAARAAMLGQFGRRVRS